MAELRTEEEQLEALKKWWKENGRSIVVAIAVAVAAVLGWQGWQKYHEKQATEASALYQNLVQSVVIELDENPDPQLQRIMHLGNQLKENHAKSTYSHYAALMLARAAVQVQNYDQALAELDWVIERAKEEDLKRVASIRKARVLVAVNQPEQARAVLTAITPGAFTALYYEVLGDIAVQQGDFDAAMAAYDQALAAAEDQPTRPVLQMKRDDLMRGAG